MARDKDFSLISVNADDDQEIVIQAGAIKEESEEQEEASSEGLDNFSQESSPGILSEDQTAEEDRGASEQASAVIDQIDDDAPYRGMTLEDLKNDGPAPKARLMVIVAALLIIVISAVYYYVSMN